ncbi:MAG: PilZ domain-containing protein [Terriglobales bacterium]
MDMVEVDSFALLCQMVMPAEVLNDENRAFPRWLSRFPILHGQGLPIRFGLAADINDDGMCFLTAAAYPVGTVILLEMRIPGGPIQVKALVRYCTGRAAGVQFLNLSREQRMVLLSFCVVGQRRRPN